MNRIESRMNYLKENNKKAFITYTTAGFPDMKKTKEIIFAQEEAGIDVIELGIPFSDPVADGPVIQDASVKAINAGANLEKVFVLMKELRDEKCEVPILFMMYYNTAYHTDLMLLLRNVPSAELTALSFLTCLMRSRMKFLQL